MLPFLFVTNCDTNECGEILCGLNTIRTPQEDLLEIVLFELLPKL